MSDVCQSVGPTTPPLRWRSNKPLRKQAMFLANLCNDHMCMGTGQHNLM